MYRIEQVIIYVRYSKRGKEFIKYVGIDNVIRANADQLIFEKIRWGISLEASSRTFNWFRIRVE